MKENFIELPQLIYNIAIIKENHFFFDKNSLINFPNNHIQTFKICKSNGLITNDKRFKANENIYPGILSETARLLNQVLSIGYEILWFEYDFKTRKVHSPGTSPQIKNRAIDILEYATLNDCWNYDHFWDAEGKIKEIIYIEKKDAAWLLDRQKIKYSFGGEKKINECVNKQPQETAEQFCERLKNEGKELNFIAHALKKNYMQITAFRIGVLLDPLTESAKKASKNPADLQRSRGRKLINQSNEEDNS